MRQVSQVVPNVFQLRTIIGMVGGAANTWAFEGTFAHFDRRAACDAIVPAANLAIADFHLLAAVRAIEDDHLRSRSRRESLRSSRPECLSQQRPNRPRTFRRGP